MAEANIFDYIEVFYNRQRRHSHLGGVLNTRGIPILMMSFRYFSTAYSN